MNLKDRLVIEQIIIFMYMYMLSPIKYAAGPFSSNKAPRMLVHGRRCRPSFEATVAQSAHS